MGRKITKTGRKVVRPEDVAATLAAKVPQKLIGDLRKLIDESRQSVAQTVNTALVRLYWNIG